MFFRSLRTFCVVDVLDKHSNTRNANAQRIIICSASMELALLRVPPLGGAHANSQQSCANIRYGRTVARFWSLRRTPRVKRRLRTLRFRFVFVVVLFEVVVVVFGALCLENSTLFTSLCVCVMRGFV